MMISEKVAAKLNEQVSNEYGAFWLYQSMAFRLETMGLKTFAKWFYAQAAEEQAHAVKMATYLLDQGAEVKLQSLPEPKYDFASVEEVCKGGLDHELKVTAQINKLMDLAKEANDHATQSFLGYFIDEQVEEVATATELLELVKMAQTPGQLMMLESRIMSLRGEA